MFVVGMSILMLVINIIVYYMGCGRGYKDGLARAIKAIEEIAVEEHGMSVEEFRQKVKESDYGRSKKIGV